MAPDSFVTLEKYGKSELEIKNSVFIGQSKRIYSPEEAEEFVVEVRKTYPDARHSCYAWILDNNMHMQKYSDDGEPSGTAGLPILSVLEKGGITNSVIVVTRYFGGVLLGKGGLVRAYTDAAIEAIKDSGVIAVSKGIAFEIKVKYDMADKLLFAIKSQGWNVEDIIYAENVTIVCVCDYSDEENLKAFVIDKSSGRAEAIKCGERELRTKVER